MFGRKKYFEVARITNKTWGDCRTIANATKSANARIRIVTHKPTLFQY